LNTIRTRRPRKDPSPLAEWGVPIIQGARTFALHYAKAAAERPVDPEHCPVLGARTIYGGIARALDRNVAHAASDSLADRVRAALAEGLAGQDAVARELGMSPPTLRRRLAERGTGFRRLRAEALEDIARLRLKSGASTAQVAEELGFSDGRSFARAFRGWTGRSPRDYRHGHAAD
ncbi:MAG: AraC family transcriptional regulator, partial [Sphingomonadales bacterium]|nr:AraC family transcriptional regulator [Sphingomonadales bacterium]